MDVDMQIDDRKIEDKIEELARKGKALDLIKAIDDLRYKNPEAFTEGLVPLMCCDCFDVFFSDYLWKSYCPDCTPKLS